MSSARVCGMHVCLPLPRTFFSGRDVVGRNTFRDVDRVQMMAREAAGYRQWDSVGFGRGVTETDAGWGGRSLRAFGAGSPRQNWHIFFIFSFFDPLHQKDKNPCLPSPEERCAGRDRPCPWRGKSHVTTAVHPHPPPQQPPHSTHQSSLSLVTFC